MQTQSPHASERQLELDHGTPLETQPHAHQQGGYGWNDGESLRAGNVRRSRLLGLFSLALGVSELLMPKRIAELSGISDGPGRELLLRALGAREIMSGIALLARPEAAGPLWSRVAGDAMDIALLGAAIRSDGSGNKRAAVAGTALLGIATLDAVSALRASRKESLQKLVLPIHVVKSITVDQPPDVVYAFWRDLENLPQFMQHLESVRQEVDGSVWRARGPAGTTIEWRAEITLDRPNEAIAWRSLEGTSVPNRGVVRFKPGPSGRDTEVLVELKYDPPAGALGAAIAKLFGEEPGQQIEGDLQRLKQVLEMRSFA